MLIPTRLPPCFALHDPGDPTCDGDPQGTTEEDRAPCGVVPLCRAAKLAAGAQGMERSDFLRFDVAPGGQALASIPDVTVLSGMLEPEGEDMSVPALEELEDLPQEEKPRRWRRSFEWTWLYRSCSHLVLHWRKVLMAQFPWADLNVPPRVALPGQVVEIDEGTLKARLTWRMKVSADRETYLGRAIIYRRKRQIDILLPIGIEQLSTLVGARTIKKLHPGRTYKKMFPVVCRGLDMEGVSIAAEAVGAAARRGIIDVRPVEPDRS